jgi:hypothetical protein
MPFAKIAAVAAVSSVAALIGVYAYGTKLLIEEDAKKQCDDIFALARELYAEKNRA